MRWESYFTKIVPSKVFQFELYKRFMPFQIQLNLSILKENPAWESVIPDTYQCKEQDLLVEVDQKQLSYRIKSFRDTSKVLQDWTPLEN